jgi:hypothetical protein
VFTLLVADPIHVVAGDGLGCEKEFRFFRRRFVVWVTEQAACPSAEGPALGDLAAVDAGDADDVARAGGGRGGVAALEPGAVGGVGAEPENVDLGGGRVLGAELGFAVAEEGGDEREVFGIGVAQVGA